jgi:hypothetical protein
MNFEIKENLIKKYDAVQVTDRFRKGEYVIEFRENAGLSDFIEPIKFHTPWTTSRRNLRMISLSTR